MTQTSLPTSRNQIERATAELLASKHLTPEDLALWHSFKCSSREIAWNGKVFKVYNKAGELARFEVYDCDASLADGMAVGIKWLTGEYAGTPEWIDQQPRKLGPFKLFAWVPYLMEVHYMDNGRGSPQTLSIPLAFRSAHALSHLNDTDAFVALA